MSSPVFFEKAEDFRAWLSAQAHEAKELLVGFHKVGTGKPCMSWSESVDQALCHGWIDGVRKRVDDATYTIRFTPRKAGSIWSAVNIDKVAKLREQGLMTPAGEAAFAQRSEDRSRVYSHERETPAELSPEDLARFQRHKAAWAFFEACPPGARKRMLHVVTSAKKPETRAARLDRLIAACAEGRRLDVWTPDKNQ
ncbi:YdeI/OmpD-associated family protein [Telluria mixta]|uniref:YdeI/OmpD-associated family protein n=1 Tax=Telluria mixta TaxID=34071 RepID=A0ABT2C5G8_9BURK|nr:YdeI/OmpD-associated family protein [Telluria mixta]MCS0632630.1 YdeI/OmpD-associated family protein [Telluria mixta]WEM99078.1 YdeI/OmpD-associated family protein [Telluria mixta]